MPGLPASDRTFVEQVSGLSSRSQNRRSSLQGPTGNRDKLAKELSDRVGALKAFLDKNAPSDKKLVPGGKPLPLQAQMAGGAAGQARLVGAAAIDDRSRPGPAEAVLSFPISAIYERNQRGAGATARLGTRQCPTRRRRGTAILAARLAGDWSAVVEVEGCAGPELAAELNAPSLTVVCRGHAATARRAGSARVA